MTPTCTSEFLDRVSFQKDPITIIPLQFRPIQVINCSLLIYYEELNILFSGWLFTRPISEFQPNALQYALRGTSLVTTNTDRLMCDSFDFYKNGCDGYWHLFSGSEANALLPSPPRIIRDNFAKLV